MFFRVDFSQNPSELIECVLVILMSLLQLFPVVFPFSLFSCFSNCVLPVLALLSSNLRGSSFSFTMIIFFGSCLDENSRIVLHILFELISFSVMVTLDHLWKDSGFRNSLSARRGKCKHSGMTLCDKESPSSQRVFCSASLLTALPLLVRESFAPPPPPASESFAPDIPSSSLRVFCSALPWGGECQEQSKIWIFFTPNPP